MINIMKSRRKGSVNIFWVIGGMVLIYFIALSYSFNGWGYAGYHHNYHPSFFYWGGPQVYTNASAREQSIGGSRFSGGGLQPGK